jgi:acyl transferase domain-containing protein
METTYEAIENAGVSLQALKGSDTSVHVGAYATE